MPTDYVPGTVDGYPKFASNLIDHVKANQKTWTHYIPKWMYRLIENNIPTMTTTPKVWFESHFKSDRNDASAFRPTPLVWDINCDISYSTKRSTPSVCVLKNPMKIKGTNNVIIDFKDADSANKAKPTGCNGLIKHVIKDTAPQSHEEFTHSTLATRTPHTLEFPNEFSGKRVWIVMCWQNARGIIGRWTEMQTAIIP
ncbi:MAG: hypothetical protein FWG98_14895 [Candidatus Cloacimonetes bacterium]|nr:hypothetical protein [Candidatus Cloacimonadota bacterium]